MLRARLWSAKHLIRSTFFRIFSPSKEIPFREKWMFRLFRTRWSCNLGCRVGLPPWLAASLFYSISPGINLFFRYTSWAAGVCSTWAMNMVVVPTSSVTESWHRNQENFSTTREKKGSAIYGLSRVVCLRDISVKKSNLKRGHKLASFLLGSEANGIKPTRGYSSCFETGPLLSDFFLNSHQGYKITW